jgi:hypothetical protein
METARARSENLVVLLRREQHSMADFLVALVAFDADRGWADLGHASLFAYLHRELKLSKSAAQYRKVAAELIQAVPAVVEPLRRGELCLSTIIEVAKVVTPENSGTVLPRFYGLSRREAEEVVAEFQPHPAPPLRTVITALRLPPTAAASAPAPEPAPGSGFTMSGSAEEPERSPGRDEPPLPAAKLKPLTADLRRLCVTVSAEFARKLEAARDARPDLTVEQLLEAGLDLVLQKSAKAKGLVDRPQKNPRASKDDGRVPAHVKREVMKRSGGRCEHVLPSGERCGTRHRCEFHHVVARAKGGKSTVENIRLYCWGHNDVAAREDFGHDAMDRYTRRRNAAVDREP